MSHEMTGAEARALLAAWRHIVEREQCAVHGSINRRAHRRESARAHARGEQPGHRDLMERR